MKTINLLTTAFLIALTSTAFAQKMKLTDGSFKDMSGQSSVLVVYKYDDMNVGTGKREMKESAYIERKKGEYNEKEAGRGDNWEKSWKGDRESRFHGKFEALFNLSFIVLPIPLFSIFSTAIILYPSFLIFLNSEYKFLADSRRLFFLLK